MDGHILQPDLNLDTPFSGEKERCVQMPLVLTHGATTTICGALVTWFLQGHSSQIYWSPAKSTTGSLPHDMTSV